MANPLLEFVLSLVRDPDAAARYAADPERAIADAHLTDVTRVDVNSLIPVVSESMSAGAMDDNVWTSGQAVSAFDAFGDELPAQVTGDDLVAAGREVIDASGVPDTEGVSSVISDLSAPDPGVPDRLGAFDDVLDAPDGMPAVGDAVVGGEWFDDGLDAVSPPLDGHGGPDGSGDPGGLEDLEDLPHQAGGFDAFGQ